MIRLAPLLLVALATPALAQRVAPRVCYVFCDPDDPRTMDGARSCDRPTALAPPSPLPAALDGRVVPTGALVAVALRRRPDGRVVSVERTAEALRTATVPPRRTP